MIIKTLYSELKSKLGREPLQEEYNNFLSSFIYEKVDINDLEGYVEEYVDKYFNECINCGRKKYYYETISNDDNENFCCNDCLYDYEHPDDSWKDEPRTAEIRRGIV